MATYSVGLKGAQADQSLFNPQLVTLEDAAASALAYQATQGGVFLGKGQDGQQAYYQLDTERSIPGVSRVLRRVT